MAKRNNKLLSRSFNCQRCSAPVYSAWAIIDDRERRIVLDGDGSGPLACDDGQWQVYTSELGAGDAVLALLIVEPHSDPELERLRAHACQ